MRTDTLKMTSKPPNQPQAKVQTGTYAAPAAILRAVPVTPAPLGSERRRGQRVLLRVRASIHMALQGQRETINVATLSVNPHVLWS